MSKDLNDYCQNEIKQYFKDQTDSKEILRLRE